MTTRARWLVKAASWKGICPEGKTAKAYAHV